MTHRADDANPARTLARRTVLKGAALAAAVSAAPDLTAQAAPRHAPPRGRTDDDAVVARSGAATVDTRSGKVAGYVRKGIPLKAKTPLRT